MPEKLSDKDVCRPTHREGDHLGREATPIDAPKSLLAAQRDRCLVLLVAKRGAVNRPRLYAGILNCSAFSLQIARKWRADERT